MRHTIATLGPGACFCCGKALAGEGQMQERVVYVASGPSTVYSLSAAAFISQAGAATLQRVRDEVRKRVLF